MSGGQEGQGDNVRGSAAPTIITCVRYLHCGRSGRSSTSARRRVPYPAASTTTEKEDMDTAPDTNTGDGDTVLLCHN